MDRRVGHTPICSEFVPFRSLDSNKMTIDDSPSDSISIDRTRHHGGPTLVRTYGAVFPVLVETGARSSSVADPESPTRGREQADYRQVKDALAAERGNQLEGRAVEPVQADGCSDPQVTVVGLGNFGDFSGRCAAGRKRLVVILDELARRIQGQCRRQWQRQPNGRDCAPESLPGGLLNDRKPLGRRHADLRGRSVPAACPKSTGSPRTRPLAAHGWIVPVLIPSIADRTSSPKTVAGAIFEALDGDGESIAFHSAEGKQSSKGAMDTLSARWIHWPATTLPLFRSRSFERRHSDKNSYRAATQRGRFGVDGRWCRPRYRGRRSRFSDFRSGVSLPANKYVEAASTTRTRYRLSLSFQRPR